MAKRWKDLSPRTRTLIVTAAVAEACLKAAVIADLRKRPADEIRGPKQAWAMSMIINSAGLIPLAYFTFGRRRGPATAR